MSAFADGQNPSTVSNVNAQGVSGPAVILSWSQPFDNVGVEGYNLYRDGRYFTTVQGGSSTSYVDREISANQRYGYTVVAFDNARNYSTQSDVASASTGSSSNSNSDSGNRSSSNNSPTASGTPAAPNRPQAQVLNSSSARISWNTPSGGAEGYNIYRDNAYVATVKGSNSFTATSLSSGRSYAFSVVAFRGDNYSIRSASTSVSTNGNSNAPDNNDSSPQASDTPAAGGTPNAPGNLQAQALNSSSVQLSWNAPGGGAEGYNVYRDNSYIATVKGSTGYTVTSLDSGRSYSFTVVAFRGNNFSAHSAEQQVSTGGGSAQPAPAPVSPPNNYTSSGSVPSGYELVFSEEFNQGSVDASKWDTKYRWGADLIINNESQYYVDIQSDPNFGASPFIFDGNNMTIRATRTPDWLRGKAKGQPYLSGAMTTFNHFRMTYGYVEMRARMPAGKGLWPAFWLLHTADAGERPEIDVMELLGDNTRLVYQTYHWFENGNLRSTPSFQAPGPDYSRNFHTFGMLWEPGRITWYVDGVATNSFASGDVSDESMYLLINLALGGGWAGLPDGSTPFPADFQIDYIRAYQAR